ncbi:MAG: hypothetical protein ACI85O_002404, partial [Saprospiraceae bacterium]
ENSGKISSQNVHINRVTYLSRFTYLNKFLLIVKL